MAIKEVQIAGTDRENQWTKRHWENRKVTLQDAERIWKTKSWDQFSTGKEGKHGYEIRKGR